MNEVGLYKRHLDWFPTVPDKEDWSYSEIRRKVIRQKLPNNAVTVFCIKRDPIKRFLSAYKQMYWLKHIKNIETLINEWDFLMEQKPVLKEHFRTQTSFYSSDKTIFSNIFNHDNLKEVKIFLEDYSKCILPELHLQQSGYKEDIKLTSMQLDFIHNKYEQDYKNNWF
ncbi:uncharacterized protein METZ01_LOCUS68313 [marine metagenome]|uniref:Sulfotransferase domain-containing protein n=1 Tax=marine metagenome TaxID=408172 RepID=A0A381TI22_9ZZZZ